MTRSVEEYYPLNRTKRISSNMLSRVDPDGSAAPPLYKILVVSRPVGQECKGCPAMVDRRTLDIEVRLPKKRESNNSNLSGRGLINTPPRCPDQNTSVGYL